MENERMAKAKGHTSALENHQHQEPTECDDDEDVDKSEVEKEHFLTILSSFQYYKHHCLKKLRQAEINYQQMPKRYQEMLPDYHNHLKHLFGAVLCNDNLIQAIIRDTKRLFENQEMPSISEASSDHLHFGQYPKGVTAFQMDKVISTLKQFVRDWSSEGQRERDQCYSPLIDYLCTLYPEAECNRSSIHVLVPGAGLGRLAYEFANKGFSSQGNEFSYYMLLSSYFILNKSTGVNQFKLYPYVTQFCNNVSSRDQLQFIQVPDVNPGEVRQHDGDFSMIAGDFLEAYTRPHSWHVVVSSFFLDTAHNVIAYLDRIYQILKPGGYFLNIGPLLYHFADMPDEVSVELSYEQIRHVMTQLGFNVLHERMDVPCNYTQNQRSMMHYSYNCVFFVAQKPATTSDAADTSQLSPESPPTEATGNTAAADTPS